MNTVIHQKNKKELGINQSKLKKKNFLEKIHVFLDIFIVASSFITAYGIKRFLLPGPFAGLSITPNYYVMLAQILVTWLIADMIFIPNRAIFTKPFRKVIADNIKMLSAVTVALMAVDFMFKIDSSRLLLIIFCFNSFSLLILSKITVRSLHKRHYLRDLNRMNVLIIGTRGRARQVIEHINNNKDHYSILGCIDTDRDLIGTIITDNVRVIGTVDEIKEITLTNTVDEVIFAMPLKKIESVDIYTHARDDRNTGKDNT